MNTRAIRRLKKLSEAAVATSGDERALILKTILKILDECTDAEYDFAEINFRDKLIAAGVTYAEYLHARKAGLASPEPPTENW